MIISALRVLKLNKEHNLVSGLSEREQFNPEGIDLELRVGQVEKIISPGFLGIEDRITPKTEIIASIERDGKKKVKMRPGQYYLVKTIESVHVPSEKVSVEEGRTPRYLSPDVKPRTTLQRCSIILVKSTTNPGYNGPLVFGLYNAGDQDFEFDLGASMFKIEFREVLGEIKRAYSGQHQDGRTTSQGEKEIQT